jgi:RimJ/RimL family protein N-acetyltransferase
MIEGFETARLAMRPITLDDVDLLVALDADPEVMRLINGGKPRSRAEVETAVQRALGHRWLAYNGSEFIGWFSLDPSERGDPALGYRLRREAWGNGFATEGSLALIELAFTQLGASRVWAQTMTVNARSRAVMERCGLTFVRTFFGEWDDMIEGGEHGDVEYELTKSDWQHRRG